MRIKAKKKKRVARREAEFALQRQRKYDELQKKLKQQERNTNDN